MNILFKLLIIFGIFCQIHGKTVTSLCSKPINNPNKLGNTKESVCDCVTENSPTWGELVLVIDCTEKSFENDGFKAEILPNFTVSLDLPYNKFTTLPIFEGGELNFLDASYNQIHSLVAKNFEKISNLMHLDLSNNELVNIDQNAFDGLSKLTELHLAHNLLHHLPENVFAPLSSLSYLVLSGNIGLNDTFSQVGVDLFLRLGTTPNLQKLEIERCNLSAIDLGRGSWLSEVYLAGNNIRDLTEMPTGVRVLDFSQNPVETLPHSFFVQMSSLEMVLCQDMPELTTVDALSFYPLQNLKHVSFRGSRKLSNFDAEAFGRLPSDERLPKLDILNLQGTNIHTLNESMYDLLKNTAAIDLDGTPLECDCNIRWIKQLNVETNGQCRSPKYLRGVLLSGVPDKNLECRLFPKWVYTTINSILILLVLVLCSLAVWFVTMKLRRATDNRHKTTIHSSSPYSPVTVVTNVRESNTTYY